MVKTKLIMKKPKKPLNPMEAYRRKNKEKEKNKVMIICIEALTEFQHKTHRREQQDSRPSFEGKRQEAPVNLQNYDGDNLSEGFEG